MSVCPLWPYFSPTVEIIISFGPSEHIDLIWELLFINCSLVNIGVKMIPLDSADSAVFSSIKTISDYKFVEIFCTWVRKLKKLHFFWRTISWKMWRFQISRKKFIRQKRVAELVSLLPCNLETRDRNAGEATFPFFLFFCSFLPLRWNRNLARNFN